MKKTKMLKKNYEFRFALTRGKYYSGKRVEAFIKYNKKEKDNNFLGIAISSKVSKAVGRNRIKRLIRESYYFFEDNLKTSYTIVFLWKKNVDSQEANFLNIKNDIKNIFEKADIFVKEKK